uniref:Uncharacterized protein n=1 Tax=Timema poppense TaxID=170557 RepID=A0A7R9HEU7_TIMPO|nr:unnamed protein product [Timema poppensis]
MAMSGNHKFGVTRSFAKQGHVTDVHALIGEHLGQDFILDGGITPSSFMRALPAHIAAVVLSSLGERYQHILQLLF